MAHIFDITATEQKAVSLDTSGKGEVSFTVTNVTGNAAKARAVLAPEKSLILAWLKLAGEPERLIQPRMSDTFVVKVVVPPGTAPGDYDFRLDAISVARPDEDSTQGPTVAIPVTLPPTAHKPFPWWILIVAAIVIGGLSYAALKLIPNNDIAVPDLQSKSMTEGQSLLMSQHLKLGTVDSVVTDKSKVDMIVRQTPAPLTKVPPGSSINIEVGMAIVIVPPLKGPLEAAQKALRDAHLDLGEIKPINQAGQLTPGIVLDTEPAEGNSVQSHTKVTLTVQAGTVEVPDLTGQNLAQVILSLVAHNLKRGTLTGMPIDAEMTGTRGRLVGSAISSWSSKGQTVPVGTLIDLTFPPRNDSAPVESYQIDAMAKFLKGLDTMSTSDLERFSGLLSGGRGSTGVGR